MSAADDSSTAAMVIGDPVVPILDIPPDESIPLSNATIVGDEVVKEPGAEEEVVEEVGAAAGDQMDVDDNSTKDSTVTQDQLDKNTTKESTVTVVSEEVKVVNVSTTAEPVSADEVKETIVETVLRVTVEETSTVVVDTVRVEIGNEGTTLGKRDREDDDVANTNPNSDAAAGEDEAAACGSAPLLKKSKSEAEVVALVQDSIADVGEEKKTVGEVPPGSNADPQVVAQVQDAVADTGEEKKTADAGEEKKTAATGEEKKTVEQPVQLGPMTFHSAVEMFTYFYDLLHGWVSNVDMNKYEFLVLSDLLSKGHSDAQTKIGSGIKSFQIRFHPGWRSRCYYLLRTDGTVDDFSYRKCVDRLMPLPESLFSPSGELIVEKLFGPEDKWAKKGRGRGGFSDGGGFHGGKNSNRGGRGGRGGRRGGGRGGHWKS